MTDEILPTPDTARAGWMPTKSTMIGGSAGYVVAQVVTPAIDFLVSTYLTHAPLTPSTRDAVTALCIMAVGYFFPDGGRK